MATLVALEDMFKDWGLLAPVLMHFMSPIVTKENKPPFATNGQPYWVTQDFLKLLLLVA